MNHPFDLLASNLLDLLYELHDDTYASSSAAAMASILNAVTWKRQGRHICCL